MDEGELQFPDQEEFLDRLFLRDRGRGRDEPRETVHSASEWTVCEVDDESLNDLDYGACVDAVAGGCRTLSGARAAAEVMLRPVADREMIEARMRDVRALAAPDEPISACLGDGAASERSALWCTMAPSEMDDDTREALAEPFFNVVPEAGSRALNACWPILWGCGVYNAYMAPLLAICAPLVYLLTPFCMLRWKLNIPVTPGMYARMMYHAMLGTNSTMRFALGSPLATLVQISSLAATAIVYAQAVWSTLKASRRLRAVCARISEATLAAEAVTRASAAACDRALELCGAGFFDRWLPRALESHPSSALPSQPPASPSPRGSEPGPGAAPLWRRESAVALSRYAGMDRRALRGRLLGLAAVDVVAALGRLLSARGRDGGPLFCQPEIAGAPSRPLLAVKAGWCPGVTVRAPGAAGGPAGEGESQAAAHRGAAPAIAAAQLAAVPNDAALSWPRRRGMLVTGANATGKSTVLRVLGCSALMGQSVGLLPAERGALTPLRYVCTMMRVRDAPEKGLSRFQAELMRAGHCMDTAKSQSRRGGGLVLLDEVFAGSSDAGSSAACGSRVLDVLADSPGALIVLSTHQTSLADWAEKIKGFEAWRMLPRGYSIARGRNAESNAAEQMSRIIR